MINFGFKDYKTKFPNWSKHHKVLGTHVKRIYKNGEQILPKDEKIKQLIAENEEVLKAKHVNLFNRETGEHSKATDYYLPLKNLDYEEANIEHYFVGASNTKQTTHARLTFLLEYDKFILDYSYTSSGSFATSFSDLVDEIGSIEDIIEEVVSKEKPLEETGITEGRDGGYHIVLATPQGEPIDAEVEKHELLNSLVGIEVYRFDQEIMD